MSFRPIVFLDIDGVLATNATYAAARAPLDKKGVHAMSEEDIDKYHNELLCQKRVALLNKLTDASGAAIVVSSSWRLDNKIARKLRYAGVTGEIVGRTPRRQAGERGLEILAWRLEQMHEGPFVILDDDDDMGPLKENLVRTSMEHGLREEDVNMALQILARN
jgi:hypothetical protein